MREGLLPVVTYSGPLLADLLVGSFQNLFQIPGIGVFLVNSSINRDYTMVVGLGILYSVPLLTLNLLVDVVYGMLDKRVNYGRRNPIQRSAAWPTVELVESPNRRARLRFRDRPAMVASVFNRSVLLAVCWPWVSDRQPTQRRTVAEPSAGTGSAPMCTGATCA